MRNDDAHIQLIGFGVGLILSSYLMVYYFTAISLLMMCVGTVLITVGVIEGLDRSEIKR